ncbi:CAP domain-containing protein [Geobacter sp. FeAm09]|uniref:CAP domain-containing protein n=1 Tax=Geobacter sp. FeAm09 TaxID=2597769 RepID=UPI00143DFD91|nr:CAP domain-containing protein [Geobacter sp. FeAm09]
MGFAARKSDDDFNGGGTYPAHRTSGFARNVQRTTKNLLGQVLSRIGILKSPDITVPSTLQAKLANITDAGEIAAGERQMLGDLLLQSGYITQDQLDFALAEQKCSGEKIGDVFVRLGMLTELPLQSILSFQSNQGKATASPLRLGDLLVETGQITRANLEYALHKQKTSHKKLGEILIDEGYVSASGVAHGIKLQKMLVTASLAAIISLSSVESGEAGTAETDTGPKNMIQSVLHESRQFSRFSQKELELWDLINEYRQENGLPAIESSRSLTKVARVHAIDLYSNAPAEGRDDRGLGCSLHSWSDKGNWRQVCYTKDNKYAEYMWDKPREITNFTYTGDGYENAYSTSEKEINPKRVLEAWKKSPSHNAILLEKGQWAGSKLAALGVGVYKNYAIIWLGTESDPAGPVQATMSLASN